jgi:hypothetical protein
MLNKRASAILLGHMHTDAETKGLGHEHFQGGAQRLDALLGSSGMFLMRQAPQDAQACAKMPKAFLMMA